MFVAVVVLAWVTSRLVTWFMSPGLPSSQHISEIGLYIKGSLNSHTLCITDSFENPTQRNGFLNKCLKVMSTTSLRYGLGEEGPKLNTCFAPTCTGCAARIDSPCWPKRNANECQNAVALQESNLAWRSCIGSRNDTFQ